MKFAWWPHTINPAVASYRLRCARIVEQLQCDGFDAGIYRPGIKPEILVLSKRYDHSSVEIARKLREDYGTRLVLDLCDNHFYAESASDLWRKRAEALRHAITAVDLVVASTDQLAGVIASETACKNIVVIGDAVESPYQPGGIFRAWHLLAEMRLLSLHTDMAKDGIPEGHRLVWFGNHGSGNAEGGMSDLSHLQDILECCHQNYPISLTVISNHRAKYQRTMLSWLIPTYYLDWNLATFSRALKWHNVAVIPVTRNPFTLCKTNNRVATALLHGLGVVADSIPSYQPLADYVELDNWEGGIIRLIEDRKYKDESVAAGVQKINHEWSVGHIADFWLTALVSIDEEKPNAHRQLPFAK
jgi:hypothetical protein